LNISTAQESLVLENLEQENLTRVPTEWQSTLGKYTETDVRRELANPLAHFSRRRLEALLSPAATGLLEELAQASRKVTRLRFGNAVNLYAPLYVSNYCVNQCRYCGFNCTHHDERRRLTVDEAVEEAMLIAAEGFRDLLLVSGEDVNYIHVNYLAELAGRLRGMFSSLSIEVQVLTQEEYKTLFDAGIDGVTIYQETYDRAAYAYYHPAGPKADYENRLRSQEGAARAGMRKLGLGALLGLRDWRYETLCLALHARTLMKHWWQSKISFSFPRMRPAHEVREDFPHLVSDRELVQMICALRLCFADAGLVLSTRESAEFRNQALHFGITQMSAGSKTNPGGYGEEKSSTRQFDIADNRLVSEVHDYLENQGFDPVWKDWDCGFHRCEGNDR
jgi:2-iminoacetate synthase